MLIVCTYICDFLGLMIVKLKCVCRGFSNTQSTVEITWMVTCISSSDIVYFINFPSLTAQFYLNEKCVETAVLYIFMCVLAMGWTILGSQFESWQCQEFLLLHVIQTGSRTTQAFYEMDTAALSQEVNGKDVNLTTQFQLVPRSAPPYIFMAQRLVKHSISEASI